MKELEAFQNQYRGLLASWAAFEIEKSSNGELISEIERLYNIHVGVFKRTNCGNCLHDAFIMLMRINITKIMKENNTELEFGLKNGQLLYDPQNKDMSYLLTSHTLKLQGNDLAIRHIIHHPNREWLLDQFTRRPSDKRIEEMIEEYRVRVEGAEPSDPVVDLTTLKGMKAEAQRLEYPTEEWEGIKTKAEMSAYLISKEEGDKVPDGGDSPEGNSSLEGDEGGESTDPDVE